MIKYRSFYGNVVLEKRYCNYCEKYAFVIDGVIQCCDRRTKPQEEESFESRRETEAIFVRKHLSQSDKKRLLKIQDYKCFYCECSLVVNPPVFDHISPFSLSANNSFLNFVACCSDCNSLKSDKVFETRTDAENDFVEKSKGRKEKRMAIKKFRL